MALVRSKLQFVRTCPDQFEFRPNSTGRVCNFSDFNSDVRTSLQFFGIDPDDFETSPNSSVDGRRTAGLNLQFIRTHPDEIAIHPNSSGFRSLRMSEFEIHSNSSGRFCSLSEIVRMSLQFARTRPERRSTESRRATGVESATRPNWSRRNCDLTSADNFDFLKKNTFC